MSTGDQVRKGWYELYDGFARFHGKHPDSALLIHTDPEGAYDHEADLKLLGLGPGQVAFSPSYPVKTGEMTQRDMAGWYGTGHVYCCASWGEGFCVPLYEAAACGLPLIGTDCSAVTEAVKGSGGWLVKSEPKRNPVHKRRWRAPLVASLEAQLSRAYAAWKAGQTAKGRGAWQARCGRAREFALGYDADLVYGLRWRPLIKQAEEQSIG